MVGRSATCSSTPTKLPVELRRGRSRGRLQISLARRSSRTSTRSLPSSADSSLLAPGRVPPSNLGLADSFTQRLGTADPRLGGYRADRRPVRGVLRLQLGDHPDRPLPQLRRIARSTPHDSIFLSQHGASGNSGALQLGACPARSAWGAPCWSVAALNLTTSSAGTRLRSFTSMPCALAHSRAAEAPITARPGVDPLAIVTTAWLRLPKRPGGLVQVAHALQQDLPGGPLPRRAVAGENLR